MASLRLCEKSLGGFSLTTDSLHLPTRIFLVLLRLAIGWHFLYEGLTKWETHRPTAPAVRWSAEGYLRNATGPLGSYFRGFVIDPDGTERLSRLEADLPPALEQQWKDQLAAFEQRFELDDKQKEQARKVLEDIKKTAIDWLKKNESFVADYLVAVKKFRDDETRPLAAFERERLFSDRLRGLQAQRTYLLGKVDQWTAGLEAGLEAVLTDEQRAEKKTKPTLAEFRPGDWRHHWSTLDWINFATVYGLMVMGICLMLGFFTRLAALGAVVFLGSLYLAMPPWPGLPSTEAMGGHYLFVNFQLIELLAVLAVAGSGRWAGVDALICAAFGRRRRASATPTPLRVDRKV